MKNTTIITILLVLAIQFSKAQTATIIKTLNSTGCEPSNNNQDAWENNLWNGMFFYQGKSTTGGINLCVTDGTNAGTKVVLNFSSGSIINTFPAKDFIYITSNVVITVSPFVVNTILYKSDGTAAGTVQLYSGISSGTYFGSDNQNKRNYSVDGNIMYFRGYDTTNGGELWRTDGTVVGTYLIKDIKPGTGTSYTDSFVKMGSYTYFVAASTGFDRKLWRTDGTTLGTEQIAVAEPFFCAGSNIGIINNQLIFFANDNTNGVQPWVSDGTPSGTYMLANVGTQPSSLQNLQLRFNDKYVFFMALDLASNYILWRTDGTISGTIPLTTAGTITAEGNFSGGGYCAMSNEYLYWIGGNQKIYRTNGQPDGTWNVISGLSSTANMIQYNGAAWFKSENLSYPYRTDGTAAGTVRVFSDIFTSYGYFTKNNKLFFFGTKSSQVHLFEYQGDFTFNGLANTDWQNKNNWNGYIVPGITDLVTIPSGQTVNLNASGSAKNAIVDGNVNLVAGNLNVYGTVALSNAAKITLNANNLNLKGSASTITGNATSYIVTNGTGKVSVENLGIARGNVTIPIGTATTYNPVSIVNTGTIDTFSTRVELGTAATYTGETQGTALTEKVVNATWYINEGTLGGSNTDIQLQWNGGQELANFDRPTAKMGHFNGATWDFLSGTVSGTNPYTIAATGITSFSPFSVLNQSALSVKNYDTLSGVIYPNPVAEVLNISFTENISKIEIINMLGQVLQSKTINSKEHKADVSGLPKGIYLLKAFIDNEEVKTLKIIKK